MEKEFVPYEQALALKELGFDEPCFKGYTGEYKTLISFSSTNTNTSVKNALPTKPFTAPLYQQAFRWFRDKYELYPQINLHDRENKETWRITITILGYYDLAYNQNIAKEPYHKTYEEAELECLKKLIEIVKKK